MIETQAMYNFKVYVIQLWSYNLYTCFIKETPPPKHSYMTWGVMDNMIMAVSIPIIPVMAPYFNVKLIHIGSDV